MTKISLSTEAIQEFLEAITVRNEQISQLSQTILDLNERLNKVEFSTCTNCLAKTDRAMENLKRNRTENGIAVTGYAEYPG